MHGSGNSPMRSLPPPPRTALSRFREWRCGVRFQCTWLLAGVLFCAGAVAQAQQAVAPAASQTVIRTETRLVLVDTVVTAKKGAYIHDLVLKDFKVWEDNKEQSIKSFSFEADPSSPSASQKRYLILFFDNSTMNPGDQIRARQAAAKFIDNNAGPNRLMAVVNFGGSVQISQNFTADAERLKQVVSGVKSSAVSPNVEVASIGMLVWAGPRRITARAAWCWPCEVWPKTWPTFPAQKPSSCSPPVFR